MIVSEYRYNTQGQMVWRMTPGTGAEIHVLHDHEGNRINQYADYLEETNCSCDGGLWNSDVLSTAGGASAVDGSVAAMPKRFTTPGSSWGSSLQSTYLSRWFPQRLPRSVYTPNPRRWPWPKTNVAGRVVGRWLPIVGYGLIGYDLYRIYRCR